MASTMPSRVCALAIALFAVGSIRSVASARADSRLLVLGTAGPGDFSELDQSLVEAARQDSRFRVVGSLRPDSARREARCAAIDDACLTRLCARRDVDRVLYGSAAVSSTDPELLEVTLHLYDRFTLRTRDTLVGAIEIDDVDDHRELEHLSSKIIESFARFPEEGTAVVRAEPGAEVLVDGRTMGVVASNGELSITPVRAGRRILRVNRPSAPAWEAPIVVRSRDSIRVTIGAGSTVLDLEGRPSLTERREGEIDPPPDWVLTIPSDARPDPTSTDYFSVDRGLEEVRFTIPVLEEHVERGEIRTTINARVGFLPRVSGSGARVTAKLHF